MPAALKVPLAFARPCGCAHTLGVGSSLAFWYGMGANSILRIFAVLILGTLPSLYATAKGSAYAVFKVSYNETGGSVVGGVAGSAFFVSADRAISAHHVLNEKSFLPAPGFTKTRVWLVHEGDAPIEILAAHVRTESSKDFTLITFDVPRSERVFARALSAARVGRSVASDGFRANSAGPELFWSGSDIDIARVERLERLRAEGALVRRTSVTVHAADLHVTDAPAMQVSYQPIVGMSGGPVTQDGLLVGFNSFASPDRTSSWAIELP